LPPAEGFQGGDASLVVKLSVIILGWVGFAVGIIGGISSIRRRHYKLAVIGSLLVLVEGFLSILAPALRIYTIMFFVFFAMPLIILSIIALILIAISKGEFT
jgi:uncharacterized membrane protein HdeD (DUF308 family)